MAPKCSYLHLELNAGDTCLARASSEPSRSTEQISTIFAKFEREVS